MRRALIVLSAVLGLGVPWVVGAPAPAASAAPNEIIAVVVDGVGNGHGRGMSQWGAYGWAVDQRWNWVQILDHYYGGTTNGSIGNPQIRVRLTALDGAGTVGLISHGGGVTFNGVTRPSMQAVRNTSGTYDVYGAPSVACAVSSTMVVPDGPLVKGAQGDAVRQVQRFLTEFGFDPGGVDGDFGNLTEGAVKRFQADRGFIQDGEWQPEEAVAARAMIAAGSGASFTFIATSAAPTFTTTAAEPNAANVLGLCQPNGSVVHYRGSIAVSNQSGSTRVVNAVDTENYLRGVVPKEISASWAVAGGGRGAEAVRAQAVAARSYGARQNRYPPYATTCDTQSCQVYGGAATRPVATGTPRFVEDFRTDQAIRDTAGIVRFKNGTTDIVSTEFSASNGPRTAGGAFPPRDDVPGDGTSRNPNHRWTRILDADTLASRYGLGVITSASMAEPADGRYQQYDGIWFNDIVLTGSNGRTTRMNSWDFRRDHGLPSPGFTVRVVTRDTVTSSTALIGDSVGNSIAGATTSEFRTLADGTFPALHIDVLDNRFVTKTPPSPSGVQAAAAVPANTELAVVQLGYNPSANPTADIDAMMRALSARGVRRVAWVNLADIRTSGVASVYAPTNAALIAAQSRWPNLTVLDWNAASAGPERVRWFRDGVHLTTTGQAQFALWLRQSLVTMSPSTAGRLAPPRRIEIPVAGRTVTAADGTVSTIPANVTAVSLNVAAVDPVSGGFVTVWPCSVPRPLTSNLNYTQGAIDGNGVIAPVDANGKTCVYSHAATDAVIDIGGWFGPPDASGSGFTAVTPKRFIDSRKGVGVPLGRVRPEAPVTLQVVGANVQRIDGSSLTIPANAVAAAINVTAVTPSGAGYVTVWPCGVERPVVSTVNFVAGDIRANGAVAPLGAGGTLCFYTHAPTDLVVDVVGWFTAGATPASSAFVSAVPQRWVDSREGLGSPAAIRPSQPLQIEVTGRQMVVGGQLVAIPADAESVSVNITAVDPPRGGFATVWPCGTPRPLAANLNYPAGRVTANNVIATIGAGGSVCVYTHSDTHFLVDVNGWFNRTDAYAAVVPDRVVDTRSGVGPAPL